MAISTRTKPDLNKVIGNGLKYPLEFSENKKTELLELQTGIDKIHQSIRMIISTRRGERYNNPEFGCFTGDTLVPLLNGTIVPIKELVNKECWIYGVLPDGTVKPSFSPGAVYKGNKEVIEVTLDNNEKIKCTPDHRFMLRDGTYKEAKDLQENESLMPLYRQINKKGYEQTFNNKLQKFIPTHRLNHNPKNKNTVIHHKDFNKRNNYPTNLEELDKQDHFNLHSKHIKKMFEKDMPLYNKWKEPEFRLKMSSIAKTNINEHNRKYKEDPIYRKEIYKKMLPSLTREKGRTDPVILKERTRLKEAAKRQIKREANKEQIDLNIKNRKENFVKYARSVEGREHSRQLGLSRSKNIQRETVIEFSKTIQASNRDEVIKIVCNHFGISKACLTRNNIKLSELAPHISKGNKWYNHKVLSVKMLEEKQDVYDLINSDTSNFALNAGVFVHNCDAKLYVFEPNDLLLRSLLYYTISDALQRWERRITVTSITFQGTDEDSSINPNQLNIIINYKVNSTHQVGSYVYPFTLGGMPYNELVIGKTASNLGINNLLGSSI